MNSLNSDNDRLRWALAELEKQGVFRDNIHAQTDSINLVKNLSNESEIMLA